MKNLYAKQCIFFLFVLLQWSCQDKVKTASDPSKIQVLLLGVYHFDNPGLDKYNMEIDNYFSDKRQKEIEDVVNYLSDFEPNKIFIEQQPASQQRIDSLYQAFINNDLKLQELKGGRNEIYQLGFNVGKKLNVEKIHCVDAHGNWLGPYADFIADTLELSYYNENESKSKKIIEQMNEYFKTHTVAENLIYTNLWENVLKNHDYYIDVALRVKDTVGIYLTNQETTLTFEGNEYLMRSFDFENIGVELVSEWYKRNFFIYRNILEKSNKGDKILIIFGQGHVPILHHLLENNTKYEVIAPLKYLKES